MTDRIHHVFLAPGFLGIESLGEVVYFAHVRDLLTARLREHGIEARVHAVNNYATSSIRKRTLRLLEMIERQAGASDEPLHLVGHSTGGLDARLLCTPGANLGSGASNDAIAERVQSIVTIACPHRGTPLASFFTTRLGGQLLRVLSLGTTYMLRFGRWPLWVVVRMAGLFVRMHTRIGRLENSVADQMFDQLLGDFSAERRDELALLFTDMAGDVALMPQLMPESMDMFDAAVGTRAHIRCGSVAVAAKPDPFRNVLQLGLDPYAQATHTLFQALSRLTANHAAGYVSKPSEAQISQLHRGLGREPSVRDNDGIVPLFSQVWGQLIHVAQADHFDVIGQFTDPAHEPAHYDWLASGSGFNRRAFERLWGDVAGFIAASAQASRAR